VYFGPTTIGIVEVAPRQCMDPTDALLVHLLGDLIKFAELVTRHRRDDRPNTDGRRGYHRGACWT